MNIERDSGKLTKRFQLLVGSRTSPRPTPGRIRHPEPGDNDTWVESNVLVKVTQASNLFDSRVSATSHEAREGKSSPLAARRSRRAAFGTGITSETTGLQPIEVLAVNAGLFRQWTSGPWNGQLCNIRSAWSPWLDENGAIRACRSSAVQSSSTRKSDCGFAESRSISQVCKRRSSSRAPDATPTSRDIQHVPCAEPLKTSHTHEPCHSKRQTVSASASEPGESSPQSMNASSPRRRTNGSRRVTLTSSSKHVLNRGSYLAVRSGHQLR